MSGRILTREEFGSALWKQLLKEYEDSMARFDRGAETYDGDPDLTERDWIAEAYEERLDERIYALFEQIKVERNL